MGIHQTMYENDEIFESVLRQSQEECEEEDAYQAAIAASMQEEADYQAAIAASMQEEADYQAAIAAKAEAEAEAEAKAKHLYRAWEQYESMGNLLEAALGVTVDENPLCKLNLDYAQTVLKLINLLNPGKETVICVSLIEQATQQGGVIQGPMLRYAILENSTKEITLPEGLFVYGDLGVEVGNAAKLNIRCVRKNGTKCKWDARNTDHVRVTGNLSVYYFDE